MVDRYVQPQSSDYVNKCRRDYSMFVLCHRALPSIADGLASASRRILWVMNGKGGKVKSATLAGATLPLHPHAPPDDVVCTLAAPYGNNYPLLTGHGSFGTLLEPTGYGSTRYTAVELSDFAKDVLFADLNLVPMVPNYDNTLQEPKHFLPLVPLALLNPFFGLAIGYSSSIMPRAVEDVIDSQIKFLKGVNERKEPDIKFFPTSSHSSEGVRNPDQPNKTSWTFWGDVKKISAKKLSIVALPYTMKHEKYRMFLQKLKDEGVITSFVDNSNSKYNITVTMKNSPDYEDKERLLEILGLKITVHENINLVDPDQTKALTMSYREIIAYFTNWRLQWYETRYKILLEDLTVRLSRVNDVILAINNKANEKASSVKNREMFKKWLKGLGIHDLDYISSLPTYRFTKEEKQKLLNKADDIKKEMEYCTELIKDESKRKQVFIEELTEIKKKYKRAL